MLVPDLEMGYTPQEEAIPALSGSPGYQTGQQRHPPSSSLTTCGCHLHVCMCLLPVTLSSSSSVNVEYLVRQLSFSARVPWLDALAKNL